MMLTVALSVLGVVAVASAVAFLFMLFQVCRFFFIAMLSAALIFPTISHAGGCHHFFAAPVVKHHAVVAAPVVAAPVIAHHAAVVAPVIAAPVLYQAGYAIEQEAIAEKAALRALARFQAVQAQQVQQQHYCPTCQPPQVQRPVPPAAVADNIVAEKCGKCHSGASPKAGLTIDGVTPMPCDVVLESLRQIKDDRMPKGGQLTPEEKGLLMEALLGLEGK